MAWLLITGEDGSERSVVLGDRDLRIGRGAESDILLSDVQRSVSRTHAELRREQGRYVIVDLESQNGTWLNGERVQRAQLLPGGEITLGTFRLRLREGEPPRANTSTSQAPVANSGWADVEIRRPATGEERRDLPGAAAARSSKSRMGVALALGAAVVGLLAWQMLRRTGGDTGATVQTLEPASGVEPPRPMAVDATPADASPDPPAAVPTDAQDAQAGAASALRGTPAGSVSTPAGSATVMRQPRAVRAQPPVPRKPGETVDAWRNRIAALEARYEYSRAALDRGDFGSAASGFEAILRSEPGFGDAPELLVQARAGLRTAGRDLLDAGNRLDTAGDWIGALQQYERAREVDPTTPGIDAAVKRVREKLRTAGQEAFQRGLEHERLGRTAPALEEFTKALQWLPVDDPTAAVARTRADRLRLLIKD